VGQQRVLLSDFCGGNLANFHFAPRHHSATILPSGLAKANGERNSAWRPSKGTVVLITCGLPGCWARLQRSLSSSVFWCSQDKWFLITARISSTVSTTR